METDIKWQREKDRIVIIYKRFLTKTPHFMQQTRAGATSKKNPEVENGYRNEKS